MIGFLRKGLEMLYSIGEKKNILKLVEVSSAETIISDISQSSQKVEA